MIGTKRWIVKRDYGIRTIILLNRVQAIEFGALAEGHKFLSSIKREDEEIGPPSHLNYLPT